MGPQLHSSAEKGIIPSILHVIRQTVAQEILKLKINIKNDQLKKY